MNCLSIIVNDVRAIMIGSRVMAVGDVHGQYDKLKKLMRKIKFDPAQDKLIFLGDLIDRGRNRCNALIM